MANGNTRLTAFRLVPLIYSHGPNEEGGIVIGQTGNLSEAVGLDPYATNQDEGQLGEPDPASNDWRDNLHNQLAD
jgi:hypothetical protein